MARISNSVNKSEGANKPMNAGARLPVKAAESVWVSAEVIDVILNEKHTAFSRETHILVGYVKARKLKQEFGTNDDELQWYPPFFGQGMWVIPLLGEIVLLSSAIGKAGQTNQSADQQYYFPPINIWQDVNHNQLAKSSILISPASGDSEAEPCNPSGQMSSNPGIEKRPDPEPPVLLGKYFFEEPIQPLFPYEGDMIGQGRTGTSLRMSSTVKKSPYPNWWSSGDQTANGDPITIISGDHAETKDGEKNRADYKIEDVNSDGGIVILACTQKIPIEIDINWDSYDHDVTGERIPPILLDYTQVELEKPVPEKIDQIIIPVIPSTKTKQCDCRGDLTEIPIDEECPPCDEMNIPEDVVIEELIFGGQLAHYLAKRTGRGFVRDAPGTPRGISKPSAPPRTILKYLKTYDKTEIQGQTVVLCPGIFYHTVDFESNVSHLTTNASKTEYYTYQAVVSKAGTTYYERNKQTKKHVNTYILPPKGRQGDMSKRTRHFVGLDRVGYQNPGDIYTWHPRHQLEWTDYPMKKVNPVGLCGQGKYYEWTLPINQLNTSQTTQQIINCFWDDVNVFKEQIEYLLGLGCAVKLCGLGSGGTNYDGVPMSTERIEDGVDIGGMNIVLQSLANEYAYRGYSVCFVGGYRRDPCSFYPLDVNKYRHLVNTHTCVPKDPPPVEKFGEVQHGTYYGMTIVEWANDPIRNPNSIQPANWYFKITPNSSGQFQLPPGYHMSEACIATAYEDRTAWEEYAKEAWEQIHEGDIAPQTNNQSPTNQNYITLIKYWLRETFSEYLDDTCY